MAKNFLIVGGSSGIGKNIAERLKNQGENVWVAARHLPEEMQSLGVEYINLDVTQNLESSLSTAIPDTLHGLVYAPGTINLKPFHRYKTEDFLQDFEVNALGAVKVLQACMKPLKKSRGASVVLFSTVAVGIGMNFHSSIAMAKGAVEGLTKSLAAEWAAAKIRVNAVAPSLTDTPLAAKILSSDERRENSGKRHPLGRVGTVEDIAQPTLFLLSEQSNWMTGQIIGVDGGMSSLKP